MTIPNTIDTDYLDIQYKVFEHVDIVAEKMSNIRKNFGIILRKMYSSQIEKLKAELYNEFQFYEQPDLEEKLREHFTKTSKRIFHKCYQIAIKKHI